MVATMVMLYNWIWKNEYAPRRWREGVVVNLFKNGDKVDPGKYKGIALLSTVGKTFRNIVNDRMGTMMEKEEKTSEGQAGFRPCLLYTSPSPRDKRQSRMPSSA